MNSKIRRKSIAKTRLATVVALAGTILCALPTGASAQRPKRPSMPDGAMLLGEGYKYPEGPMTSPDGTLYFSESRGTRVHRRVGDAFELFYDGPEGCNGLAWGPDGNVYACGGAGAVILKITPSGESSVFVDAVDGSPLNAPNDLTFDSHGNLFFTNPLGLGKNYDSSAQASLVRVRPDGSAAVVATDAQYPNGVGVSPDGRWLYVNDLLGKSRVLRYPLDENGELGEMETIIEFGRGMPDGLAIAASGNLYVCLNLSAKIVKLSPGGEVLGEIEFPRGSGVTNACFGGADMKTLYVTLGNKGKVYGVPVDEPGMKMY